MRRNIPIRKTRCTTIGLAEVGVDGGVPYVCFHERGDEWKNILQFTGKTNLKTLVKDCQWALACGRER